MVSMHILAQDVINAGTIERWFNLFGVPLVLLVLIGMVLWRSLTWCAPRVDKMVEAHVKFIAQVGQTQQDIVTTQREIATNQVNVSKMTEAILQKVTQYQHGESSPVA